MDLDTPVERDLMPILAVKKRDHLGYEETLFIFGHNVKGPSAAAPVVKCLVPMERANRTQRASFPCLAVSRGAISHQGQQQLGHSADEQMADGHADCGWGLG